MGVETVDASRYDVTTHERWFRPPRSPTIVGNAVETIVWSSAARNMPSISAAKTVQSARPVRRPSSGTFPLLHCAVELRPRQRWMRQRGRCVGAEPVAEQCEITTPVVRRDPRRLLDHTARRPEDEREILLCEVAPKRALFMGPLD